LYPHTELYAYLGEVERGEGRNKYSGARGISLGFGFDLQNQLMIADDRRVFGRNYIMTYTMLRS
jgi:hypothetical protein